MITGGRPTEDGVVAGNGLVTRKGELLGKMTVKMSSCLGTNSEEAACTEDSSWEGCDHGKEGWGGRN